MKCTNRKTIAMAAIATFVISIPSAFAQAASPASVQMVQAGGQLNAYAVSCGKATPSQAADKRAGMRKKFLADGMSASAFDSAYDAAYAKVATAAKSDPARMKQACAQLDSRLKAMEAQSKSAP